MPAASSSQKSDKFLKMTTEPVEKLVLSLAAPNIIIMLTTSIYNMADTYFVAMLGTSEVAAVGIAFPLMSLIQAMGYFFGQGTGNYMARALGARDTEAASRMATTGFISCIGFTSILMVVGLISIAPLVDGLGATATIRPFAKDFIFFILLASPWMVASIVLNQILRFQGSASIAMVGMLSGIILNIFLAPIFIFIFGLGVKGAAIATMIGQIVSFVILLFYGCTRKGNIPIKLANFSPSVFRYAEMFRGGIPAFIRQSLMSVAVVIINIFARVYGDAAIAAISIVHRLCMFANSLLLGFGHGFQPVCGFNYGAKLYSRVKKAFWFCVRIGTIGLIIIAAVMAIFATQIISLFRKDDLEVIAIGVRGLRLGCISLPFMAMIIMSTMMNQTIGKAFEASIISISRHGFFLILFLLILSRILGITGIQLSTPMAEIAGFLIAIPIMIRVFRKLSVPDGEDES